MNQTVKRIIYIGGFLIVGIFLFVITQSVVQLKAPISDAEHRITKRHFGLEVHPGESTVPDEKFNGFHTGVDFETFADEQEREVPVSAACTGPLLMKRWATGYGGVAIQQCKLGSKDVTVIYGHLDVASVSAKVGDVIQVGTHLANLGKGNSQETDGARKHLHFGIHKSLEITIDGYVKDVSELKGFIDPVKYLGF